MEYHILVAEDDSDIVELLRLYLEGSGYKVHAAQDGEQALDIMEKEHIDMAVLDIMMPKMDGYEVTRQIQKKSRIPILILSAKIQEENKILGLNMGADDYLTKPFSPLEIIARINANLRRCYGMEHSSENKNRLRVGDLVLDMEKVILYNEKRKITLTATEFKMMALFMAHPGRIYTKRQLMEAVNGEYYEADNNTVMVHISKLREKIEEDNRKPEYIKTIRGIGYKIEKR